MDPDAAGSPVVVTRRLSNAAHTLRLQWCVSSAHPALGRVPCGAEVHDAVDGDILHEYAEQLYLPAAGVGPLAGSAQQRDRASSAAG